MTFKLPVLDYSYSSLEPFIDSKTMEIHYSKHHQTYVDKLNSALENYPELKTKKIEDILKDNLKIVPEEIKNIVRNNGGGHFNHSLFWNCLTDKKNKRDFKGKISKEIIKVFGSFEEFKKKFVEEGIKRFGSGWVWLIDDKGLKIVSTSNQDNPMMGNKKIIFGIDVWEHAYYLKYQNRRQEYLDNIWNILNWDFIEYKFVGK